MPQPPLSVSEKLMSLEVLASTLVAVFLVGGSWVSLSFASDSNKEAIADLKVVQESAVTNIAAIQTDVAVLLDRQEKQSEVSEKRLDSIDQSVKDVRMLIQQIHLQELNH